MLKVLTFITDICSSDKAGPPCPPATCKKVRGLKREDSSLTTSSYNMKSSVSERGKSTRTSFDDQGPRKTSLPQAQLSIEDLADQENWDQKTAIMENMETYLTSHIVPERMLRSRTSTIKMLDVPYKSSADMKAVFC